MSEVLLVLCSRHLSDEKIAKAYLKMKLLFGKICQVRVFTTYFFINFPLFLHSSSNMGSNEGIK